MSIQDFAQAVTIGVCLSCILLIGGVIYVAICGMAHDIRLGRRRGKKWYNSP